MAEFTLVVGNKNYSSWSLRAWLAAKQAGIAFEEVLIPLDQPDTKERIRAFSGAGKVPALMHGERAIWDSLAIIEYLAEIRPEAGLWTADQAARAVARSISAEMHAGFAALRGHMPMNLRKSLQGKGRGPGVDADIERIATIWRASRKHFGEGGPYLFGKFTGADAMFAPVATRFRTYGVETDEVGGAYVEAIHANPWFQEWRTAGIEETWIIPHDEVE